MALGLTVELTPPGLVPLRPVLLSCRLIEAVDAQLLGALKLDPARHASFGLVTCDQDDATYVALDHATKFADVDVVFAKSFYAGARHASGPFSGEILGILAGPDPEVVTEGLWALREGLRESICFHTFAGAGQPAFFAHVITQTGRYLPPQADLAPGEPMAYLIAPPIESVIGLDAALKAARVRLARHIPPPSETNFGGAYLVGELAELEAAAVAFVEAIRAFVAAPLKGSRRPARLRR
ncbi:MAG: ethanolamine utilization microcompartment protein EutL [Deltaproteobacteria bacterium]|nr:ethanolamine utilization microcompartment protein EutL [Deltaproteobacteria bacterium]